MITLKSKADLNAMRECGDVMKSVLDFTSSIIKSGMTTLELNDRIADYIRSFGATAPCLGYSGYPAETCISIDDMVVHGIPSNQMIWEGQIVSVDLVVGYKGFMTDAARTFKIGEVSDEKEKLVKVTEECFFKAIENLMDGTPLGNVGYAVQSHAEANGFSSVRALTGHGIGKNMHEDPSIPNYGRKGTGIRLKQGMTFCIEPMINAGTYDVKFMSDGWGVKTKDGKPSAHYENTVALTENGLEILTL